MVASTKPPMSSGALLKRALVMLVSGITLDPDVGFRSTGVSCFGHYIDTFLWIRTLERGARARRTVALNLNHGALLRCCRVLESKGKVVHPARHHACPCHNQRAALRPGAGLRNRVAAARHGQRGIVRGGRPRQTRNGDASSKPRVWLESDRNGVEHPCTCTCTHAQALPCPYLCSQDLLGYLSRVRGRQNVPHGQNHEPKHTHPATRRSAG